jgi:hypothetical protein
VPRKKRDAKVHAWDYAQVAREHGVTLTNDAVMQETIVRCLEPTGARGDLESTGTEFFSRTFFPGMFKKPNTHQQYEYLRLIDDDTIPFLAVLARRRFAKTTIGLGFLTRRLALRSEKFILYHSGIYDIAAQRTEALKGMLLSPQISAYFGDMNPERYQGRSPAFSKDAWFLVNPATNTPFACVMPKGALQACNGALAPLDDGMSRVTLIWADDSQPRANIDNEAVRQRYEDWVYGELLQTVDNDEQPTGKDSRWDAPETGAWTAPWRVILSDTCKHTDAWMMNALADAEWHSRTYPLAIETSPGVYSSLDANVSNKNVQALAARFRARPDVFAREYLCKPRSSAEKGFDENWLKHYNDRRASPNWGEEHKRFLVVDPACTKDKKSACTSILGCAVNPYGRKIRFRDNLVRKMYPEEMFRNLFDMALALKTRTIAVEETGGSKMLRYTFEQAAKARGLGGEIRWIWLKSNRSEYDGDESIKQLRGEMLLPYYEDGLIEHDESLRHGPLERALKPFPFCKQWDAVDTAAHSLAVMKEMGILLHPDPKKVLSFELDDSDARKDKDLQDFLNNLEWCMP